VKTFAYCAASFEKSVRRAAGVTPLLSPPVSFQGFLPEWLEGYDLLYFKLHGFPDQAYWYGDDWITAMSEELVRQSDLRETIVFVANCYLPESPMLKALLYAGAKAVIGGAGVNYARSKQVDGADLLGLYLRFFMQVGLSASNSLTLAKNRIRIKRKSMVKSDTLDFKIYRA